MLHYELESAYDLKTSMKGSEFKKLDKLLMRHEWHHADITVIPPRLIWKAIKDAAS